MPCTARIEQPGEIAGTLRRAHFEMEINPEAFGNAEFDVFLDEAFETGELGFPAIAAPFGSSTCPEKLNAGWRGCAKPGL